MLGSVETLWAGRAVFMAQEEAAICDDDPLWALRQATKRALKEGAAMQPFIVAQEETVFPGSLRRAAGSARELEALVGALDLIAGGSVRGAYRCAALWDINREEGLLAHREDKKWFVAVLPPVDEFTWKREAALASSLEALAEGARGVWLPGAQGERIPVSVSLCSLAALLRADEP